MKKLTTKETALVKNISFIICRYLIGRQMSLILVQSIWNTSQFGINIFLVIIFVLM